jgi:hypothetical protein
VPVYKSTANDFKDVEPMYGESKEEITKDMEEHFQHMADDAYWKLPSLVTNKQWAVIRADYIKRLRETFLETLEEIPVESFD